MRLYCAVGAGAGLACFPRSMAAQRQEVPGVVPLEADRPGTPSQSADSRFTALGPLPRLSGSVS